MKIQTKFPNHISVIGFVVDVIHEGSTKGSGARVDAVVLNPSTRDERFDLRLTVTGYGRLANRLVSMCGTNEVVHVSGRLATINQFSNRGPTVKLIAETITSIDAAADSYECETEVA